jgi:hypothetical protein
MRPCVLPLHLQPQVYKGVLSPGEFNLMVDELTSGPCIAFEVADRDGANPVEQVGGRPEAGYGSTRPVPTIQQAGHINSGGGVPDSPSCGFVFRQAA